MPYPGRCRRLLADVRYRVLCRGRVTLAGHPEPANPAEAELHFGTVIPGIGPAVKSEKPTAQPVLDWNMLIAAPLLERAPRRAAQYPCVSPRSAGHQPLISIPNPQNADKVV